MKVENLEDLYELSPLQQGILFHDRFAPGSGVYIEQLMTTFRGKLDAAATRRAWQTILDRHPMLRTAFYWENQDKPLQVVHRRVELPWEELDWQALGADEQTERLHAYLKDDRRVGFDPVRAPLLRLTLFRMGPDTYRFLLRFHHLIMDGWSMGLVLQEFIALYKAFSRHRHIQLPASRPFRDYVAWLKRQDLRKAEVFWRGALRGVTGPTPLNVGWPPGRSNGSNGAAATHDRIEIRFGHLAAPLQALARTHQVTLNTIVQGAWSVLLSRVSGEEDVIAGATVAGRPHDLRGSDSIVGLMIDTLAVRTKVPRERPALEWLKDFQAEQVLVREHGYAPLVQVHKWSGVPHGVPLFESIVVFENVPLPQVTLEEEGLEIVDTVYDGRPHYPISLVIFPGADLPVRIIYDRSRYNADAIRQILGHLRTLLEGIVADPAAPLSRVPLMEAAERQRVLVDWNATARAYAAGTLHGLVEAQVARTPEAAAVIVGDETISYGALDRHANRVAQTLRNVGVGPETRVGVCLERNGALVATLLGVLKAGGAYVPLDPGYPAERLAFMVRDSGAQVVVTTGALAARLPAGTPVVCVEAVEEDEAAAEAPTSPVRAGATWRM